MAVKQLIKKFFNLFGFTISRNIESANKIDAESKAEQKKLERESYYTDHSKIFLWLKEFNFKCIIDVGANEGQFAGSISQIFPDADIHCFEPLENVFHQLKENFKNRKNIFFYNCGLGEKTEGKKIFKNEYSPSSSLLEMLDLHKSNFDFAVNVTAENISIKRLDDLFSGNIKKPLLIKIDVQGYEMYVLKGGDSVIKQADVIIIETSFYPLYDLQPLFEDIYEYLKKIGFKYAGNVEQLNAPSDQKILQADAVFIKN